MYNKRCRFPVIVFFFFALAAIVCCKQTESGNSVLTDEPQVLDERLMLTAVAQDPEIVTPIGIAIDAKDRIYVLESHTHSPPNDYNGPKGDLIKVFKDSDGDDHLDQISVFAEGIKEGMNLAFSPQGHLHLVTSREVWVFYDRDGDGVCDEKKKLLELKKPQNVYPHAAMLSITFSKDGFMYLGRGNTGSESWIFEGSDGSHVAGYGDGGNIIRAKWDGSQVEIFSTGYWNPFDLKFDNYGRLLVADNDPDSRGPNRLVHAVYKSDFGYKSLFGGSGIHPYLAWNGELPGTLPIAVPLGEAPSGLVNASLSNLPQDYQGQMLCTIWEESSIVRISLKEKGLSVTGNAEVIVKGGENFRPIAFAVNSKGEIYFTDWVVRYYPNHGKGKIWKLTSKDKKKRYHHVNKPQVSIPNPSEKLLNDLEHSQVSELKSHLKSDDPFQRHAAVIVLSNRRDEIKIIAKDEDAIIRMGALLAAKKSGHPELEILAKSFLTDPDLHIRRMALIWIGSSQMFQLKSEIEKALKVNVPSNELIETYLETVKLLQPEFVNAFKKQVSPQAKILKRDLPKNFISNIIYDSKNPIEMRVFALRHLNNPGGHKKLLLSLLSDGTTDKLRLATIRTLQAFPDRALAAKLLEISIDSKNSVELRSEALAGLSKQPFDSEEKLIHLLENKEENIRVETARLLRSKISQPKVLAAFEKTLNKTTAGSAFQQQLLLGLGRELTRRPAITDDKSWYDLLDGTGNIERGRRVFYSNTSLCSSCHAMDGVGGDLGPDLSNVGKSKDRRQLISSLLQPSASMSPEWQGWFIKFKDGYFEQGRQIDVGNEDIKLYTQAKGFIAIAKKDIADYGMVKESLMPGGLEKRLSDQDIKDLLAYLGRFD